MNKSSVLSVKKTPGRGLEVRLQHAFRAADEKTLHALAAYIQDGDPDSGVCLDAFLKENQGLFHLLVRKSSPRALEYKGRHHNLAHLLAEVARVHGLCVEGIRIGWASVTKSSVKRSSIRLGSWSAVFRIVRVHPVLDSPAVPDFFVEYVIYHEVLHSLCPVRCREGRTRRIHTESFRKMERQFYRCLEAVEFERSFVRSFLG
ncbi:MAG: hypothetical protein KKA60_02380 [Proteobacteria bacterium]|nr:hypothetical protein [Pseudomonadota bacterium]